MVDFLLIQITYFWETMWIEGSSRWKLFVYYWLTKLNIPKTSSYYVEIMNVRVLIGFMGSMMNVLGFRF